LGARLSPSVIMEDREFSLFFMKNLSLAYKLGTFRGNQRPPLKGG
jgi:hypothetical protein